VRIANFVSDFHAATLEVTDLGQRREVRIQMRQEVGQRNPAVEPADAMHQVAQRCRATQYKVNPKPGLVDAVLSHRSIPGALMSGVPYKQVHVHHAGPSPRPSPASA
jgi:hypothetical protein